MSKSIYRAGRTIIADEFIELGGNSSTTSIMQSVNLAVNQKKINELKSEIEKINSDGIITPPEKQSLKREWGNLESSYNKTYSQFENDDNLKNNSTWISLQQDFAELDSIMSKVLSNMNISYSESDTERIDDLFYSCWTLINECSGIYENALDFHNRYELRILGQKEFNDSTELSAATYSKTLNQFTNMPDSEFSWYRTSDGRLIKSSSKTCSFVISDLNEEKECEFYCLWTHSLGDNDNSVVKIVVFFTLSIKKITEYQWNNIESESDLNKQDIYWSLEKTNQPDDMIYLWIRESDDNRETWVYSRWSGLQGPEGPQGWSQATIQLYKRSSIIPESYDGEAVIYTFATGSIEGNTGTWNKEIPTGSELLYTIFASCLSKQQTDIIQPNEWTEPQQISTEGTKGENGISVATVFIYQRSQSSPSLPTQTASYNFLNGQLYVQAPWSNIIPSGADPCWVSTATASSRTSSANIDISKWSTPVILVQNGQDGQDGQDGNDGIGISSLIEEYGISNSINLIPTQWNPTRPTRNEGEILWYRVKIIYTDESVIYTDAIPITGDKGDKGDKGESGENAPTPIYQYAWGGSQTVPPSPNIWVWRGKFFIWKHKFVGKDVNSLWGEYKNKPENKKVFLWTRISNDNGKTWSKPICISGNDGDDAVVFDINITPSSYKMTTRKYVKEDQVIQLLCEKSESYKGKEAAVWEIVSTTYLKFCDITGEIIYEGNSMTGDSVYVLVKTGMEETTFKIVCTVSDIGTKETYVSGDYSEFVPEYIGKVDSTLGQKWPTMTENGPVKKGDLIVYIKSDESGNKTSEYYICVDEAKAGTADGWSVNIVDSHNNSSNMIKGIYDAILSGSTNADLLRMIDTLVARYIAAQLIRVTGAIFGGDYKIDESSGQIVHIDDPDEQENEGQGFSIDKNGLLRAVKAELNKLVATDANVQGVLKSQALYTRDEIQKQIVLNPDFGGTFTFTIIHNSEHTLSDKSNQFYTFKAQDRSYLYFLDGTNFFRISKMTGEISPIDTNITVTDSENMGYLAFDIIDSNIAVTESSAVYIPGISDPPRWVLWTGNDFSNMKKVTDIANFSNQPPFSGIQRFICVGDLCFVGIDANSNPGIYRCIINSSEVYYWSSGWSLTDVTAVINPWEGDKTHFIVLSNNKLYRTTQFFFDEDDYISPEFMSSETVCALYNCQDYIMIMTRSGSENYIRYYRMTSFSTDAIQLVYELNSDEEFSDYSFDYSVSSHTYLNDMHIFSTYNSYAHKWVISTSKDLSVYYTFKANINFNSYINTGIYIYTGCAAVSYSDKLLLAGSKQILEVTFSADDLIDYLNSIEGQPLLFRSSVSGELAYHGERKNLKSISCSSTAAEIEFQDGEVAILKKGQKFGLPVVLYSLTIIANSSACITKDITPESDGTFYLGSGINRFNAFINNLDVNSLKANEIKEYSDTLQPGEIYKDESGNLKIK